ncbi:hypothetical protein E4T56_gene7936, partial [Termitomyces sp. T112]
KVFEKAKAEGATAVIVSAAIEADLVGMDAEERTEFLSELGLKETGLARLIRAGYELLGLLTFFTVGPKEARAWTVAKGSKAPQAAGAIHSDFERGFIRAETIAYDDYVSLGGEAPCRDAGKLRQEGKEYVTKDGDVFHFKFNGETQSFGRYEVKREEVIDFARAYDPHEFHLSDEAAAGSHFGRLSASGWHTCAMTMRMMVDQMHEKGIASMGGAGVDELRWTAPVYPGDVLRVESELLEKRRSRSRPEMGLIQRRNTVFNQENRAVMSFLVPGMIALRDPSAPFDE